MTVLASKQWTDALSHWLKCIGWWFECSIEMHCIPCRKTGQSHHGSNDWFDSFQNDCEFGSYMRGLLLHPFKPTRSIGLYWSHAIQTGAPELRQRIGYKKLCPMCKTCVEHEDEVSQMDLILLAPISAKLQHIHYHIPSFASLKQL